MYGVCAFLTLLGSTCFHWFGCKSPCTYKYLRRCDLSTISLNLFGAFFPAMYYLFYCNTYWLGFYGSLQISSFVLLMYCAMQDWFYTPEYLRYRSNLYVFTGLFMATPLFHGIVLS